MRSATHSRVVPGSKTGRATHPDAQSTDADASLHTLRHLIGAMTTPDSTPAGTALTDFRCSPPATKNNRAAIRPTVSLSAPPLDNAASKAPEACSFPLGAREPRIVE